MIYVVIVLLWLYTGFNSILLCHMGPYGYRQKDVYIYIHSKNQLGPVAKNATPRPPAAN